MYFQFTEKKPTHLLMLFFVFDGHFNKGLWKESFLFSMLAWVCVPRDFMQCGVCIDTLCMITAN